MAGDIAISIEKWRGPDLPQQFGYEYAAIRLQIEAEDAPTALEQIQAPLELVLDDLSFQMQAGLVVLQLEILDVTPPVAAGDERRILLFPFPNGYQQWKFARSTPMGTDAVEIVPALRKDYGALPKRTQQALDWYIKGLHAPVDADRFIFFWIALEVLEVDAQVMVEDVYRANCGHEIPNCPECGRSTSRRVAGLTLRKFLGGVGVAPDVSKRLWRMRMLVHGAKSFDPTELADLGELLQVLRAAVVALLKERLGLQQDRPPFVSHGAPAIGFFSLGGTRAVTDDDLPEDRPATA